MSAVSQIAKAHGINSYFLIDYGAVDSPRALCTFLYGSVTVANLTKTLQKYASEWGIRVWPRIDISEPIPGDMLTFVQAAAQVSGGASQTVMQYLWAYNTQFYPVATAGGIPVSPAVYLPGNPIDPNANINNLEYMLSGGAVVPSLSVNGQGVVIDSPGLYPSFRKGYDAINATAGGLNKYTAISGAPLSDHPVNTGNTGGANMNSYRRFANSTYFSSQVNASGNHTKDGSRCQIFFLKGQSTGYIGNAQIPSLALVQDVETYHKIGEPFAGVVDGFSAYMGFANAMLELANWQYASASFSMWMRTPITPNIYNQIPAFAAAPKEVIQALPDAFALFQQTGGEVGTCYFNWSNPGDDGSVSIGTIVGGVPSDESASASQVLNFALSVVPNWSHHQHFEADTMGGPSPKWPAYTTQPPILVRAATTSWPHFGSLLSKMTHPGGWFGYETNAINFLFIDHYYNNPWNVSPFGLICHQWGTDSYAPLSGWNLSAFNVLYGLPDKRNDATYAADLAAIKSYVQSGGNLIVPVDLQSGWDPSVNDLLGASWAASGGSGALSVVSTHPIFAPYSSADLVAAFTSFRGNATSKRTITSATALISDSVAGPLAWVNSYGSGKVVALPIARYGDGFVVNGSGECDGLASGSGYLVLNSVLWLGGQPTPAIYLPKYVSRTGWAIPLNSNGQGGHPFVSITVNGTKAGQKLVWLSNNNAVPMQISFNLSSSFYGFSNPYSLSDVNMGTVLNGTGDVIVNVSVPAQDWLPFYTSPSSQISTRMSLVAKQV